MPVHPWFWVWVMLSVILLVTEAFSQDYYMLPFAVGAAAAAVLEYFGVAIDWQWIAFLGLSSVVLVGIQRHRLMRTRTFIDARTDGADNRDAEHGTGS